LGLANGLRFSGGCRIGAARPRRP